NPGTFSYSPPDPARRHTSTRWMGASDVTRKPTVIDSASVAPSRPARVIRGGRTGFGTVRFTRTVAASLSPSSLRTATASDSAHPAGGFTGTDRREHVRGQH